MPLQTPRRRAAPMPRVFWQFAAYWRLPAPLAQIWWQALSASRYSAPTALRQALLLWAGAPIANATSVVQGTAAPSVVLDVVEALVHEGRLARTVATQVEEYLLARVTARGTWQ